jgi:hypothetical protein
MAALGIVSPSTHGQIWYEVARRGCAVLGVLSVGLFGSDDTTWQRRSVIALAAAACALHLVTPLGTPQPQIDVFAWTQTAVDALLHGVHPYTVHALDVYGGSRDVGYTVTVYPYMPATLVADAPWFALFGDFRYGLAVCLPLTIWLVRSAGRRLGLDGRITDVVTLRLVLHVGGPVLVRAGVDVAPHRVAAVYLELAVLVRALEGLAALARWESSLDRGSLWAGLFDLRENLLRRALEDLSALAA